MHLFSKISLSSFVFTCESLKLYFNHSKSAPLFLVIFEKKNKVCSVKSASKALRRNLIGGFCFKIIFEASFCLEIQVEAILNSKNFITEGDIRPDN
ncbi:hypothetical protein ACDT14_13525, partial [Staphylococcus aureus]